MDFTIITSIHLICILLVLSIQCSLQLSGVTPSPRNAGRSIVTDSTRRKLIGSVVAAASVASASSAGVSASTSTETLAGPRLPSQYYDLPYSIAPDEGRYYFPALTPPFNNRATFRYNLGRDSWALEQLLTFANVTATIRCNVIKLKSTGGLWAHSPQWPTGEFCKLLDECGVVEHVVLPCNAFEHKAPMQAFIEKYPNTQVWISPGQYGPLGRCGTTLIDRQNDMPYRVDGILGDNTDSPRRRRQPPWLDEFDMAVLYVDLPKNAGPVSEVAFYHRPTKTLISTDAVVYIPSSPPDILRTYFDKEVIESDPTFWPRSVLQAVFLPLRSDSTMSNNKIVSYPGYEALSGRLVRAPILRAVVDARAPDAVREWIIQQTDGSWQYDRIISSHFASPIDASPSDVRASFEYLFEDDVEKLQNSKSLPPIACQDWELLDSINQFIAKTNAGEPAVFPFQRGCVEKTNKAN